MKQYKRAGDEIKQRCNIVDVIGAAVPLKRSGSSYKACCPFHNEKTPSFIVSEQKQSYHCYGCGEHGDVFSFYEKYYNLNYTEAVERLASQYGVTIEEDDTPDNRKRSLYLSINIKAAKFFFDKIAEKDNEGYKYISGRGITNDTIQLFGLGYTGREWDGLYKYLHGLGFADEDIVALGLCSKSEKGRMYDKYRERLMFPIRDTKGNVIGFGGRIIAEGEPKYLNSPESEVFLKKNNLFGLDKAKDAITKSGYAFLVEGYMDMVSLYQGGVKNAVASLGTALTEQQAKLLRRYCKKVILCYDADKAGIQAALRGIDVLRAADMEVKVLHVEGAKDPDEYVKKYGAEAFIKLSETKALSDVNYKVALISAKYSLSDTEESIKFLKAVTKVLRELSPGECDLYIKDIAKKLSISEDALRNEVMYGKREEKPGTAVNRDNGKNEEPVTASKSDLRLEQMLLRLSMINSGYFRKFVDYEGAFVSDAGISIAGILSSQYREGADFSMDRLIDYLGDSELVYLKQIINTIPVGDEIAAYDDCIRRLENKKIERRKTELKNAIEMLDELGDDCDKKERFSQLARELEALNK